MHVASWGGGGRMGVRPSRFWLRINCSPPQNFWPPCTTRPPQIFRPCNMPVGMVYSPPLQQSNWAPEYTTLKRWWLHCGSPTCLLPCVLLLLFLVLCCFNFQNSLFWSIFDFGRYYLSCTYYLKSVIYLTISNNKKSNPLIIYHFLQGLENSRTLIVKTCYVMKSFGCYLESSPLHIT